MNTNKSNCLFAHLIYEINNLIFKGVLKLLNIKH
jgi:hypothetical protein